MIYITSIYLTNKTNFNNLEFMIRNYYDPMEKDVRNW